MLQPINTILVALTSPAGETNYFSQLLEATIPGTNDPMFNIINCTRICKTCSKLERIKQLQCTHVKSPAHWLSSRKERELRSLYKYNLEDGLREFGGLVVSDYSSALRSEEVTDLFARSYYRGNVPPSYVFTTCDPSAGTPKSHLAICSAYYIPGTNHMVVSFSIYISIARSTKALTMFLMLGSPYGRLNVAFTCSWSRGM